MSDFDLQTSMEDTLREIQSDEPIEEAPETIEEPSDDRPRDEHGRFVTQGDAGDEPDTGGESEAAPGDEDASAPVSAEEPASPEGVIPPETPIGGVPDNQPESADASLANAPNSWRAKAKAKWNEADPIFREEVLKREAEMLEGVRIQGERAEFGRQMDSMIQPYMPTIRAVGATPDQAVQAGLDVFNVMVGNVDPMMKAAKTIETARQYGFLDHVVAQLTDQQGQTPYVDPNVLALQQQIQGLQSQLQERDQAVQQQQEQAIQAEINEFATAAKPDGTLQHPYFENVRGLMSQLMMADERMTLAKAYESACRADPDVYSVIQAEDQLQKEAGRQAEKAGRVNISKKGSYDSAPDEEPAGSLEDTLQATMNKIRQQAES